MFSVKYRINPTDRKAPPNDARTPLIMTHRYLNRKILIPELSAARGCSPAARIESPQVVLKKMNPRKIAII
jgi:hypothetical protein